ncbi:MAG: hypothetical protein BWY79_01868 [Actinobacteria bacterium ADurb.Bin444]|nr:MAG: hypothetical protein BWY79_01868 [Actinobacteria bacterium ADurb.Bin444]
MPTTSAAPTAKLAMLAAVKGIFLKNESWTSGSVCLSSHTTNTAKAMTLPAIHQGLTPNAPTSELPPRPMVREANAAAISAAPI